MTPSPLSVSSFFLFFSFLPRGLLSCLPRVPLWKISPTYEGEWSVEAHHVSLIGGQWLHRLTSTDAKGPGMGRWRDEEDSPSEILVVWPCKPTGNSRKRSHDELYA